MTDVGDSHRFSMIFLLETGREEEKKIVTAEMKSDERCGCDISFFPHCST